MLTLTQRCVHCGLFTLKLMDTKMKVHKAEVQSTIKKKISKDQKLEFI